MESENVILVFWQFLNFCRLQMMFIKHVEEICNLGSIGKKTAECVKYVDYPVELQGDLQIPQ